MREGGRGTGNPRPLAGIRRGLRWRFRSHKQIWIMYTAGYLAWAAAIVLIDGWPRHWGLAFVAPTAPFIGAAMGQSYGLRRRQPS